MSRANWHRSLLTQAAARKKAALRAHPCAICGKRGGVWKYPGMLALLGINGEHAHTRCLRIGAKEVTRNPKCNCNGPAREPTKGSQHPDCHRPHPRALCACDACHWAKRVTEAMVNLKGGEQP